jgi:rhodanese-related sulfurtransferase
MKKKIIASLLLIQCLFAFNTIEVTKQNIIKLHKENVTIIDIRLPYEWKQTGVIPFAKKITFFTREGINPNFLQILTKNHLNKNSKIALICRSGHRSRVASEILERQGFKNITTLKGGMFALFRNMLKNDFKGVK